MTTDGVWFRRKGRSWPMLVCSICAFPRSVFVKGAFSPARRALTSTGWRKSLRESRFLLAAEVSVWACADATSAARHTVKIFFMFVHFPFAGITLFRFYGYFL